MADATPKTPAQRRADLRQRRALAGFVQKQVWVHADDAADLADWLRRRAKRHEKPRATT